MKHQKEWHTCDRCGVEIEKWNLKRLYKRPYRLGERCVDSCNQVREKYYDLCAECTKDFERFMRNENINTGNSTKSG